MVPVEFVNPSFFQTFTKSSLIKSLVNYGNAVCEIGENNPVVFEKGTGNAFASGMCFYFEGAFLQLFLFYRKKENLNGTEQRYRRHFCS